MMTGKWRKTMKENTAIIIGARLEKLSICAQNYPTIRPDIESCQLTSVWSPYQAKRLENHDFQFCHYNRPLSPPLPITCLRR